MGSTEERVVRVDETGLDMLAPDGTVMTVGKTDAHLNGIRHRAISVFIFDGDRLLIQKRAGLKYHSGGIWSNTCCTHPRVGETQEDSACRRLREEMGIRCAIREVFSFPYHAEVGSGLFENEWDHVFVGDWTGEPEPDVKEVSAYRWVKVEDLTAEIASAPAAFSPWLRLGLPRVLEAIGQSIVGPEVDAGQ